jgi:serine/threonine protein kinase
MSSERFAKAGDLFDSALAMPPENRSAYLKEACGEDQLLLAEVESLLTAHQQAKGFMQSPAFKNVDLTPPEDQLSEGQQVGAYRIVRQIGRGGMGTVYLAERADEHFKKYVAVKLVKRGMDTDYILRHFRNERQILANFDHPNIARLLDGGSTEGGLPYFVMEYVEGKPIDQYCDENKLSITHRLELFQQVCAAVAYAHRNLVIHRDIKPSNILVTSGGVPKLLDF